MYILPIFSHSFHSVHKLGYDVMCIRLSGCLIHETTGDAGVSLIADQSTAALLHRQPALLYHSVTANAPRKAVKDTLCIFIKSGIRGALTAHRVV